MKIRSLLCFILSALVVLLAGPAFGQSKKAPPKAFGFVSVSEGAGAKLTFDVRWRSDGTTVARYRGFRQNGKSRVPVQGTITGKVTTTDRRLKNDSVTITVPKGAPADYDEAGPGIVHRPVGWGSGSDGLDFSITMKGFDVPLVGFDVPLVGFPISPSELFDEPILFAEVAVSALSGGLDGIAVARTKNGRTTVAFAARAGGKDLLRGAMEGTSKAKLELSRPNATFKGTAVKKAVAKTLTGELRVKVGKNWKAATVHFDGIDGES